MIEIFWLKTNLMLLNYSSFDAIYLGLSGNDIDKILVEKYNDLGLNENILRDKKIYYEEILKVIRNKKFLQSP